MRAALITRSNLRTARGGDTIQAEQTAFYLGLMGIRADIRMANEIISYADYDLLHFFNLGRPSDMLKHIQKAGKPFVISPIFVDYSVYDRHHRKGISGTIFRSFSPAMNEYLKTVLRWIKGTDKLVSSSYLWKGHRKSMLEIVLKSACLLPNSPAEMEQVKKYFGQSFPYRVVPNGIDPGLFINDPVAYKDPRLVLCVARIEGIKNQLNLIKAMNNTDYKLVLIGSASPNQRTYLRACKKIAAGNIEFTGQLSQEDLVQYYTRAKVHVLPSWFETCGLSSLEAGAMGCNLVISEKGFASDYFKDMAEYCNPGDSASILQAVEKASKKTSNSLLADIIGQKYTWQIAARETAAAYHQITGL